MKAIIIKKHYLLFIVCVCILALLFIAYHSTQIIETPVQPEVSLNFQDRILILAPHPDDEILGCCGIIQRAIKLNIPLRIVFLTYGDFNQWSFLVYRGHPVFMPKAVQGMGLVRYKETLEAAKALGIPAEQLTFLGYPDFSTLDIWYSHWGARPPCESMLTKTKAVPYMNAFRPGAPYKGEEILQDLKTIFREFKPTKIFLSHPSDHNGDHKALYLFSRVALWDLEKEIKAVLCPYPVHYKDWPKPRGYFPGEKLKPPKPFEQGIAWQTCTLTPQEVEFKHAAIKKHKSQYDSSASYLLSFIRANELFGDFPVVKLQPDISSAFLSSRKEEEAGDELFEEERASFVGILERSVRLQGKNLVFTIKLSRPLGNGVGVSVYIFGYQKNRLFKDMPKLHLKFGTIGHNIFDQNLRLSRDTVKVSRKAKEIKIRISLTALKDPDYILTSAQTYLGAVPLDWVSWRVLEIQNEK